MTDELDDDDLADAAVVADTAADLLDDDRESVAGGRDEGEDDLTPMQDLGLGMLIGMTGVLVLAFSVLAFRNGFPMFFWGAGILLGPVMLLMSGASVVRVARAARGR